jgi:DNA-binding CsgD family transcriptional regulator
MAAPSSHPRTRSARARPRGPQAMQARVRVARFRVGQDQFVVVSEPMVGAADLAALTQAEREVARLVADGCSNQAIAAKRGARLQTVANQLAAVYRKLAVSSRSQLVARLVDPLAERRGHQRRP